MNGGTMMSGFGQHSGAVSADQGWGDFMISTLDAKFVKTARRGSSWHHVQGDIYRSDQGETHLCNHCCTRWVFRHDGVRICSVSGRCVRGIPQDAARDKRSAEVNLFKSGHVFAPEDAIAGMENDCMHFAPAHKKRSFRSAASEATDQDIDMDEGFNDFGF
mmetsp:Transcript_2107/g.4832  ORF Transcript_2107/g.4832 Transcript_2107/m.4832 type:complete len:161 (-) Transcript_2107:534-1016(-)